MKLAVGETSIGWATVSLVMNEGVPAVVTLPANAARVTCRALDERGEPTAQVLVAEGQSGSAVISIGPEYKTVWYEIDVAHL